MTLRHISLGSARASRNESIVPGLKVAERGHRAATIAGARCSETSSFAGIEADGSGAQELAAGSHGEDWQWLPPG